MDSGMYGLVCDSFRESDCQGAGNVSPGYTNLEDAQTAFGILEKGWIISFSARMTPLN